MLSQQLATVSGLARCAVQSRWGPYGHRAQTPKFILPKKEFDTTPWTIITKQIWEMNILMSSMFMYLRKFFFIFDIFRSSMKVRRTFLSNFNLLIFTKWGKSHNWPITIQKPPNLEYIIVTHSCILWLNLFSHVKFDKSLNNCNILKICFWDELIVNWIWDLIPYKKLNMHEIFTSQLTKCLDKKRASLISNMGPAPV